MKIGVGALSVRTCTFWDRSVRKLYKSVSTADFGLLCSHRMREVNSNQSEQAGRGYAGAMQRCWFGRVFSRLRRPLAPVFINRFLCCLVEGIQRYGVNAS